MWFPGLGFFNGVVFEAVLLQWRGFLVSELPLSNGVVFWASLLYSCGLLDCSDAIIRAILPGGATHSTKVTTYAPPFRPPFFRSLENLYGFDPYILAKIRKMSYFDPYILAKIRKVSYFDPYFSSKLGKMYSFDPPFLTPVAFRVDGRWGAPLSETGPSTPPGAILSMGVVFVADLPGRESRLLHVDIAGALVDTRKKWSWAMDNHH